MRLVDARPDAGTGQCLRGHRSGSHFILAGGLTRSGTLAASVGDGGTARTVGHHRLGSSGAGNSHLGGGSLAVAESILQWSEARPDVGLRLRSTDGADAIHERV